MSNKCQMVVFSNKAYNAIIRESFDKDPVETGGILLGHILDNGVWIVMEVLPPGIKCIFEITYFEYDDAFVNYLAQSVANQYKIPLELLGLWHRHPSSMDVFSSTDDGTNTTFALQNPSGVISGLVNIDPRFRLTMYHMDNPRNVVRQYNRPKYECVEIEVGDDIIPKEYFQLKYYDGRDSNLSPSVEHSHTRMPRSVRTERNGQRYADEEPLDIRNTIEDNLNREENDCFEPQDEKSSWINDYKKIWEILKKNKIVNLIALILVIVSIFSIKTVIDYGKSATDTVKSWINGDDLDTRQISTIGKKETDECQFVVKSQEQNLELSQCSLSSTSLKLIVGERSKLEVNGVEENENIRWISANGDIATVDGGTVTAHKAGSTKITADISGQKLGCDITVEAQKEDVTIKIKSWNNSGSGSIGLKNRTYFVPTEKTGEINEELICWKSDDSSIAEIDSKGLVNLKAVGKVKITVLYNDVEQDTLNLTITK